MSDDPRVEELLDKLIESDGTPESVCESSPELLSQVRERWRQMCHARDEFDAMFPPLIEQESLAKGPTPTTTSRPEIPGYEVEAVLGVGGMGVVFRAHHLKLNRDVALKMALAGAYAGRHERERFQREAEAVAALRHPNVVQIYDVGESAGRPYFTMEYVEGGSLAQKMAGIPLPANEAAAFLMILAKAVQAAHAAGIVHRDLKPANVLLTAEGTPKISDFGLARRVDGEAGLTRSGAAVGTPSYMAPEQARGHASAVGPAADIYALGAILYAMLTGRPPFIAESAAETILELLSRDPVPPSRLNRKVPRDLETICLKCLHKEPTLRYANASALAEDVERFLRGDPIAARPEGPIARFVRRVRRRPLLFGAMTLAVLSTIALVSGGLWLLSDRAASVRTDDGDLREMEQSLKDGAWPEARAALDRAKGHLGTRIPDSLGRIIDRGTRDLDLGIRLDAIRLSGADTVGGFLVDTDRQYAEVIETAGIGTVHDDPEVVAERIKKSNIRNALVAAFDYWSVSTPDLERRLWAMNVAGKADSEQSGWRRRARDPEVRYSPNGLRKLIATAPVDGVPVSLLLALEATLPINYDEHVAFLKRIQQANPGDCHANQRLGMVLNGNKNFEEAIGYFRAALAVRPGSAAIHNNLGHVLAAAGRRIEAIVEYRRAMELDPTGAPIRLNLILTLSALGRHDEVIAEAPTAIRLDPDSALLHTAYGACLAIKGRDEEALPELQKGALLNPKRFECQNELRGFFIRHGKMNEARNAWQAAIEANPSDHGVCYGYAELCLFLDQKDEYRLARRSLLSTFGNATDPYVCERVARASLLQIATEEEMRQAVALIDRALAADSKYYAGSVPYFHFAKGLAEFRQGHFDRAIMIMRGDASRALGPAPRLVLAMAFHQSGQTIEAVKTLDAATSSYNWKATPVIDQDGWIIHVLRREAENLIRSAAK
jgi:eukaryotic-like serine/threonine-protein kinase